MKFDTRHSIPDIRSRLLGVLLKLGDLRAEAHPGAPIVLSILDSTCAGCEKARRLLELREIEGVGIA